MPTRFEMFGQGPIQNTEVPGAEIMEKFQNELVGREYEAAADDAAAFVEVVMQAAQGMT